MDPSIIPRDADGISHVTPLVRRWILWGAAIVLVVLALRAGGRFPWRATVEAVAGADPKALAAMVVVALSCLVAKGWAWHLLLRPVAPHGWRSAQDANMVGAAVNNLSVAVMGEAARVRRLQVLAKVPLAQTVASVVWARALEGVGLAVFILAAPVFVELPPVLRGVEIGAAGILVVLAVLAWFRGWTALAQGLPEPIRRGAARLTEIGPWQRLAAPALLALANWVGQWVTFHVALVAANIRVAPQASLVVMLLTNFAGLLRLTPAGVGTMQVGFVAALLPFGVPGGQAFAASLLLQAAQIIPVMAIALALVGWSGLRDLRTQSRERPAA